MKKKLFIIICMICVLSSLIVVPSFAFDGTTWNITIVDVRSEHTYTLSVPMMDDAGNVVVTYNVSTGWVIIKDNNNEIVYQFMLPTHYIAEFDIFCSGDDEVIGQVGYNSTTSGGTIITGILSPGYDTVTCTIQLTTDDIYNQSDIQDSYNSGISDGVDTVVDNPRAYNLYSSEEYLTSRSDGINYVLNHLSEYNLYSSDEYQSSYQDGYNSANALVGVANVGFTGIFNVFSMLVNQMGIFGVSLAAVIITAVIILIIYAIFKIVKG